MRVVDDKYDTWLSVRNVNFCQKMEATLKTIAALKRSKRGELAGEIKQRNVMSVAKKC